MKKWKIILLIFRFFLLCCPGVAQSSDSTQYVSFSAGVDYFNLFKQQSSYSSSTMFLRKSYFTFSYLMQSDTLSIDVSSKRSYGTYSHSVSHWSMLFQQDLNQAVLSWKSSCSFLRYDVALQLPEKNILYPQFALHLFASPFGEEFIVRAGYSSILSAVTSHILLQDFFVPVSNTKSSKNISFGIDLSPSDFFQLSISTYERKERSVQNDREFAILYTNNSFGRSVGFRFGSEEKFLLNGDFTIEENRPSVVLENSNLSFGEFPSGEFSTYRAHVGISTVVTKLPTIIFYEQNEISVKGAGVIESWPFTSLAESVILNRFLFTVNGSLNTYQITVETIIHGESNILEPSCSYLLMKPHYTLKHWQPEFLVFGATSFSYEHSSIDALHLIKFGLTYSFALWNGRLTLSADQYLPVAVRYNSRPSQTGEVQIAPTSAEKNFIDGGRFFSVQFTY